MWWHGNVVTLPSQDVKTFSQTGPTDHFIQYWFIITFIWRDHTLVVKHQPINLIWIGNSYEHLAGCRFVGSKWSLSLPARRIQWCTGELWAEPEPPTAAIRPSPCTPPPGLHLPPTREGQKPKQAALLSNVSVCVKEISFVKFNSGSWAWFRRTRNAETL